MNLIFVGPQGSGKGTQANLISKKLGLCHISTGDLLRGVTGDLKAKVDDYMLQGKLVSAEIVTEILKERITKGDCKNGFILDGFPRNMKQAKALDEITKIDKVIEINISDKDSIKRIMNRLSCKSCGEPYNVLSKPSKQEGVCDNCGGELYRRTDDNEESLKKRLEVYHNETEPILEHYDSVKVDGMQEIHKVTEDILDELE